jgi:membrane fusion protein (multidrug efflux system)
VLRSIVAVLIVLLLGATAAGAYWKFVMVPAQAQKAASGPGSRGSGGPVAVEAVPVRVGPAETSVDAVGTLVSNESVMLRPETTGRVASIAFTEGSAVRKGEILLELDSSIERAELAQAEAQRDLTQSNFERARELRRNNVGTQRALDEAAAALRTAQAQVDLARARLDKRRLAAPFDARAGLRKVSLGEYVTGGTDIVNLEQIDPLKVDFRVPELFLSGIEPRQRITLTVDAFPGESFQGVVRAIDPQIDRTGRAIVIRAEIDNRDGRLRPGLFARVRLTLAERAEALFIPEEAVQPQGDRHFVFKVVDGGEGQQVVRLTPVRLGSRKQGEVEVLEGLASGDVIVSAGLLKIRDGVPVRPVRPEEGGAPQPGRSEGAPTAQGGGRPAGGAAAATAAPTPS